MENFKKEFSVQEKTFSKKWIFGENGITMEEYYDEEKIKKMENGTILHCYCPYGNVKDIRFLKILKGIELTFFGNNYKEHDMFIYGIDATPHDIKVAVNFTKKQLKKNKIDLEKLQIFKEVTENKFDSGEYIMQCQICGQVFRYTSADLERNEKIEKEAQKLETHAFIDAIGYNPVLSSIDSQRAENKRNTKVDYFSCPKCHSSKLKRISEKELKEIQEKENAPATTPTVSSADELKKFKELLDSGIITQEEFDAKKKQLLGL